MTATKTCTKCSEIKPLTEFSADRSKPDGWRSNCRGCMAAYRTANKDALRAQKLLYRYSMTPDAYDSLLKAQGSACAICGSLEPGGIGQFPVDHDHSCCPGMRSCGQCVRGLLCHRCNKGIGLMNDDPETLTAAANYLLSHARRR